MKLKKNIPWISKDLQLNDYKFRYELSLAIKLAVFKCRKMFPEDEIDTIEQGYNFFEYYKLKENVEANEQTIALRDCLKKLFNSNINDKSIFETLREYINKETLIILRISKKTKKLIILTIFFALLSITCVLPLIINKGKSIIVLHSNSIFLANVLYYLLHYGLYITFLLTIISILILTKKNIEISQIRRPSSLYFIKWIDSKYDIDQSILELKEIINKQITQVQTKSENPTKPKEVLENEIPYDENDNPLINWILQKIKIDPDNQKNYKELDTHNQDIYKRCVLCEFIEESQNIKNIQLDYKQYAFLWGILIPKGEKGNKGFILLLKDMNINMPDQTFNQGVHEIRNSKIKKQLDESLAKILKKYEYLKT